MDIKHEYSTFRAKEMRELHNLLNSILLKSHSSLEAFLIHYNVVIYDDSKKT